MPHATYQDDIYKKIKLEVDGFSMQLDSTDFFDWLISIEDYFTWYHVENPP